MLLIERCRWVRCKPNTAFFESQCHQLTCAIRASIRVPCTQRQLNPPTSYTDRTATFRTGDRVMQVVNNYDSCVINGDIGCAPSVARLYTALLAHSCLVHVL